MVGEVKTEPEEEEGSSLPGVAGALVNVANSKPFTALLGPAFGVLGDYWGERMKQWVDAKRAKNVAEHVEKVKTIEHIATEIIEPTERQAAAMLDWAEEAQKIDPEREDDLAALWQGILGRIYNDEDTEELVATLKQMNRGDAKALLEMSTEWFPGETLDPIRSARFQRLGLLVLFDWRPEVRDRLPSSILFVVAAVMAGFVIPPFLTVQIGEGGASGMSRLIAALSVPLAVTLALASAMAFFGPIMRRISNVRLSRLGQQLLESGSRYYQPER
ncbi:hypothetical protein [Mesorhizobium sp. WSM3224]|uniref:hypothetical protein n=1 Tax=Mesorhizobium sp. WSM3224 TaxID=1040986 RepID=UPI0012EC794E|nr:hypothetical protein [Mesorhizobium sp. WSM3224]